MKQKVFIRVKTEAIELLNEEMELWQERRNEMMETKKVVMDVQKIAWRLKMAGHAKMEHLEILNIEQVLSQQSLSKLPQ